MLIQQLASEGGWLFRRRSFLPFALLVPVAVIAPRFRYLGGDAALQMWWSLGCLAISGVGLGLRAFTVGSVPGGTSGRNTRSQQAALLNTSGMYSVVRHPLYLANFLLWLGMVLSLHNPLLTLSYGLAFWLYYERIMIAEESFLADRFGAVYPAWAARTPAFLPRWSQWRPPSLPFSWRTVLRREYCGVLGVATSFFLIDAGQQALLQGRLRFHPLWGTLLLAGVSIFLMLRFLKKHTTLLNVDGR